MFDPSHPPYEPRRNEPLTKLLDHIDLNLVEYTEEDCNRHV